MSAVDLLIAPLRILLTALGTGRLPGDDPVTALAALAPDLAGVADDALAASATVARGWSGDGGGAAVDAARRTAALTTTITDDDPQIVALTETAAGRIRVAADRLDALVDEFARVADALGPDAFGPAGLATLVPVAVGLIGRGVEVVDRTRGELSGDIADLMALTHHEAPAAAVPVSAAGPARGEGVAITLPDGSVAYAPNERAATAVRAALSQQGVPYAWGGTTPAGFDCSGLTQWAYRQAGMELPRLAQDQDTAGIPVAQGDLMPGDLAVWDGHVAMYIGNQQLVEAGDPVQVSALRTTNAGQGFQGFFRPR
ncbi:C40 family peptidase [Gordonia desulfuricans]|uniref:C40 family peptidase n=2 Tax=Gordonia desulfuricans TaxID=89051 RepID=A0A7K3LNT7_9ACTN|nr:MULTISPECIES: C40 family peptidase [Gordonia]NDK89902.1 C40 family peptidase [Gordonia desulfuricans]WLP91542.1 C40 family peptidase [Gordonia sp. NB41Y]